MTRAEKASAEILEKVADTWESLERLRDLAGNVLTGEQLKRVTDPLKERAEHVLGMLEDFPSDFPQLGRLREHLQGVK